MIKRIVKMHFREAEVSTFLSIYEESRKKIRAFEGCHHVELLRDVETPEVFFTFSIWESPAHLDKYRHSELFAGVWSQTKALFAAKAMAWSAEEQNFEE
jgi:quinol monooxygenase YgiN